MASTRGKKHRFSGPPARSYEALVRLLPPRPLHDVHDYENAVEMIGRLAGYDLNDDQADYLEALAVFVERYEAEHDETRVDLRKLSGVDLLRHLLEESGMRGADLSRLLGASAMLGPMILRGERNITASHARKLGAHFKVDPGLFIQ